MFSSYDRLAEVYLEAPDTLWARYREDWEASPLCKDLERKLRGSIIPPATNKIVCFSLDHFATYARELDEPKDFEERSWRAATQHAAALTMAKILKEKTGNEIKLIAQEPEYDADTIRILKKEGFEIVTGFGALAFTMVDENTLVFTTAPNIPVKQVVTDLANPAIMIWDVARPLEEDNDIWNLKTREIMDPARNVIIGRYDSYRP